MSPFRLAQNILLALSLSLVALQPSYGLPLFKKANICPSLFSTQKSIFEKRVAKSKIENLVEKKLLEVGLHPIDHRKDAASIGRRARRLAKKIDIYQLQNQSYRQKIIERIIDLKISENLDPLQDYELSLSQSKREALNRIILRTLINEGIDELPSRESSPSLHERFMKKLRYITSSRLFHFIAWWELPTKKYTLNDFQMAWLVNEGVEGLIKLKDVKDLIDKESRNDKIRVANTLFSRAFTAYFIFNFIFVQYPEIQQKYSEAVAEQSQEKTEEFIEQVQMSTQFDSSEILLDSARSEIEAIEADFVQRYKEKPTTEEALEIRQYVCTVRYSEILNEAQQQSCLK